MLHCILVFLLLIPPGFSGHQRHFQVQIYVFPHQVVPTTNIIIIGTPGTHHGRLMQCLECQKGESLCGGGEIKDIFIHLLKYQHYITYWTTVRTLKYNILNNKKRRKSREFNLQKYLFKHGRWTVGGSCN